MRRAAAAAVAVVLVAATAIAAGHVRLGAVEPPTWPALLHRSVDLGPSRAPRADVVVALRPSTRPADLSGWAGRRHLTVSGPTGQGWATIAGAPGDLGAALEVAVHDYRARSGQRFYASTRQPGVVAGLVSTVAAVGRISSYPTARAAFVPLGGLSPTGLVRAYDADPLRAAGMTGAGRTVVFFEIDGFALPDLDAFDRQWGLPPASVTVDGGLAGPSQGETIMDMEAVHSIAPDARLVYYNFAGPIDAASMADGFAHVGARYPGAIWSLSLGICDKVYSATDVRVMDRAVTAAEQGGTTVFASSGDAGGLDCTSSRDFGANPTTAGRGISIPAGLPAVTGVGGTSLSVSADGGYVGEEAWSEPGLSQGSGGGTATAVARPAWQPGGSGSAGYREVPDVAAVADPATSTAIFSGGHRDQGGGTSLATPVWAGFTALIDQYLAIHRAAPLGFANPALYRLAASPAPYPPFHDIVTGSNDFYQAGPGYDPVTGLGSPDVWNLARDVLVQEGGKP